MKKKVKLPIIITGSVVAAIVALVLILSFIVISPMNKLPKYDHVRFYDLNATHNLPYNDNTQAKIEEGLKTTKFSIMHAVLEGSFNYSLDVKTFMDADDDNKVKNVEMTADEIKAVMPTDTKYMLEFIYDEPVKLNVDGVEFEFDRIKLLVEDFNGEVGKLELVPYLFSRIDNMSDDENLSSAYYTVNVITVRAQTSKLMVSLSEVPDALNQK